jgi:hypothetical protein
MSCKYIPCLKLVLFLHGITIGGALSCLTILSVEAQPDYLALLVDIDMAIIGGRLPGW